LRLHEIQSTYQYGQAKKYQYFGIIALSKNQIQMFRNLDSYLQLSYEKFKNSVMSDQISIAIKEYQQIGLFNHLSTSQIEKAKVQVSEQTSSWQSRQFSGMGSDSINCSSAKINIESLLSSNSAEMRSVSLLFL